MAGCLFACTGALVFDATEDPHPGQLRERNHGMRDFPSHVVCAAAEAVSRAGVVPNASPRAMAAGAVSRVMPAAA